MQIGDLPGDLFALLIGYILAPKLRWARFGAKANDLRRGAGQRRRGAATLPGFGVTVSTWDGTIGRWLLTGHPHEYPIGTGLVKVPEHAQDEQVQLECRIPSQHQPPAARRLRVERVRHHQPTLPVGWHETNPATAVSGQCVDPYLSRAERSQRMVVGRHIGCE